MLFLSSFTDKERYTVELKSSYYTVHKFGGSSVANSERFKEVKKILSGSREVVVVSATKGTTNKLQAMLNAARDKQEWHNDLVNLEQFHQHIVIDLLPENNHSALFDILNRDFKVLAQILDTVSRISTYSEEISDYVLGYGEQWSAQILTAYLALNSTAVYLDATNVLTSFNQDGFVQIDWEKSQAALEKYFADKDFDQLVVTGFISSTAEGKRTTLGRNGSDFSGAIFARLFKAIELIIWTDVDGIYSAHPAKVKSAFPIEHLSYKEALELAYFGASVLHPLTVAPVQEANIPMWIKDSYNPTKKGTLITNDTTKTEKVIKGLTYVDDISLINIEGAGMAGVSGSAARIFNVMFNCDISIILISQASSEHSLCFAIAKKSAAKAIRALQQELKSEIDTGKISRVSSDDSCAILAAIGDGMIGNPGVAGKFFETLAKASINIRAIAQGSSERNISVVINRQDVNKALQAAHAGFYLSAQMITVGLIGPGGIGKALLNQIAQAKEMIKQRYSVDIQVRGIMSSNKMYLSEYILTDDWQGNFAKHAEAADIEKFKAHLISDDVPHSVIIDCTASKDIAKHYLDFFQSGFSVITPNKHANAGDLNYYQEIKQASNKLDVHYLYEATVCAGLPIISTLQDLIKTGDEITTIEGVFSGTLSYIFNELGKGRIFSEIVREAKELGYTEPDPREDLSGQDVARKLVCLSREIGNNLSLTDIQVTNLVPDELRECSVEEFLNRLPEFDESIMAMARQAQENNEKLCYSGKIHSDGSTSVAIQAVANTSPLARLNGTDNVVVFETNRYSKTSPMIIQGPGAGTEVTAAGVFADLLRLTSYLY